MNYSPLVQVGEALSDASHLKVASEQLTGRSVENRTDEVKYIAVWILLNEGPC